MLILMLMRISKAVFTDFNQDITPQNLLKLGQCIGCATSLWYSNGGDLIMKRLKEEDYKMIIHALNLGSQPYLPFSRKKSQPL